jgi:hypothetical protein
MSVSGGKKGVYDASRMVVVVVTYLVFEILISERA